MEIAGYSLLLSSRMDALQEGRECHGVGMLMQSTLYAHTLRLYQGHSRIMGALLDPHPLPILCLPCYTPTAGQSELEKSNLYETLDSVLTENPRAIPIPMADWNARLAAKEPLDSGIGENILPTTYALETCPKRPAKTAYSFWNS